MLQWDFYRYRVGRSSMAVQDELNIDYLFFYLLVIADIFAVLQHQWRCCWSCHRAVSYARDTWRPFLSKGEKYQDLEYNIKATYIVLLNFVNAYTFSLSNSLFLLLNDLKWPSSKCIMLIGRYIQWVWAGCVLHAPVWNVSSAAWLLCDALRVFIYFLRICLLW